MESGILFLIVLPGVHVCIRAGDIGTRGVERGLWLQVAQLFGYGTADLFGWDLFGLVPGHQKATLGMTVDEGNSHWSLKDLPEQEKEEGTPGLRGIMTHISWRPHSRHLHNGQSTQYILAIEYTRVKIHSR